MNEVVKIKCSRISYDLEFAGSGPKRTMTVAVSRDMLECLDDHDDIGDYLIDEVSEMTGVPVLNLTYSIN